MRLEALPGSVLDQKYRVERQLGKGAMGAVFQAIHLGTTRPVAVKVIVPQLAENVEFAQRFKREAEAAGRLNHPNVVNVTDFGVTQVEGQDLAYLVMEYLDGQTLGEYLQETPRPNFNFLLDVMDQTALALDAAHAAGIVHRDLKPGNIWLEPNHRGGFNVKVLDFGIAKVGSHKEQRIAAEVMETLLMAPRESEGTLAMGPRGTTNLLATPSHLRTTVGTLLGTPSYMAPEQCSGLEVDARADVYSLSVIAYQMLCGRLPFEAETLGDLIRQQIQTTPQSPCVHDATVPQALAAVVLSGLEKDPARRPPTAATFAARLRAATDGELNLLRKSKDIFHAHTSSFMPVLFACAVASCVWAIPLWMAAVRAAHAKLLSAGAAMAALACCYVLLLFFGFQLFKAAAMLMLKHASAGGQFQAARGIALRGLVSGMGSLLQTQLLSAIDLRPSSWRANALWPVVWAAEGRSGKDAIARSRELCATLPGPVVLLAVRQYSIAFMGPLLLPTVLALAGSIHLVVREVANGSPFGWFALIYGMFLGILFLNYGPAFSFLYWSILRCRNEGAEIALPQAARGDGRKAADGIRPARVIWVGLPLLMLAVLVIRATESHASQDFEDASTDGRRTTVLKAIDGGLGVDQANSNHETPLFDAVRHGDAKLVTELLARGAKVNARGRAGATPLLLAAVWDRNDLARTLLEHGASVDAVNDAGRTSLILAAMRGNAALVQLLLAHGANPLRVDSQDKTAAMYATEEGYAEITRMLSK